MASVSSSNMFLLPTCKAATGHPLSGFPATPEARYGPMTRAARMRYCGRMDWPDYLRDQAAKYRQLAEQTDDPVIKVELLELASVCEEVANNIEDHLTGG